MKIENPVPDKKVADFVQRILVIENCQVTDPFVLPLYANGTPTLLFQTTKGKVKGNSNYLTLFGQTVLPETLTIKSDFTLIAYFFKPFSLFSLFGLSARELTDNPIELNLLGPSKTRELQEQLLNSASTKDMLRIMNDYIFGLITKVQADIQLIKFATSKIAEKPGKEVIQNVQNELRLTERTLQRMFEKTIGIPPNQYRRICQFNSAFQQLQERKFSNLTDIAFENDYADQSHYIRTFKKFTHITPKDYLKFGTPDE